TQEAISILTDGKVGIGTTTPWRKLSVNGSSDLGTNALAGSFTATSTTASVFPYASTTALTVSGTNGLKVGTLNGPLQANNGTVSATTSIGVLYGGTGLTTAPTYGQMLVGNATSGYTLTATSSLGLSSVGPINTLQASNGSGGFIATGTSQLTTGILVATTSVSSSGTITANSGGLPVVLGGYPGIENQYSGLWLTSTRTGSNYAFLGQTGQTFFNVENTGVGGMEFRVSNDPRFTVGNSGAGVFIAANTTPTKPFQVNLTSGGVQGFNVETNGNVGIGTTTPWRKLSVNGSSDLGTNALAGSFTATSTTASVFPYASTTALTVSGTTYLGGDFAAGNGIKISSVGATNFIQGGTNKTLQLSSDSGFIGYGGASNTNYEHEFFGNIYGNSSLVIDGGVVFNALTASTGAGSLCLDASSEVVYNASSDSCLASLRSTKHDIETLSVDALSIVNNLQPVSFEYNEGNGRTRFGFIAEDTASINPSLATYNDDDGLTGIDDRAILSVLVKAIQEQQVQIGALTSAASDASSTESVSFVENMFDQFLDLLEAATARVKNMFVRELHVEDKLCVDDICVDKDQLKALLISAGGTSSADDEPPSTGNSTSTPVTATTTATTTTNTNNSTSTATSANQTTNSTSTETVAATSTNSSTGSSSGSGSNTTPAEVTTGGNSDSTVDSNSTTPPTSSVTNTTTEPSVSDTNSNSTTQSSSSSTTDTSSSSSNSSESSSIDSGSSQESSESSSSDAGSSSTESSI
nr:tail fiber domain-containing protein [bacterium]